MIKKFDSAKDYEKYVKQITNDCFLNTGSEGSCYKKNDLVYKVLDEDYRDYYDINSIITQNDYDLKHFAFPIDIFTNNKLTEIYGYTTKYIPNNLFGRFNAIDSLNIDNLVNNYYSMLEEVKILSKDRVFLFDIIFNLIYNNRELVAIDTLAYTKQKSNPFKENKSLLLRAVEEEMYFLSNENKIFYNQKSIEEIANNVKKLSRTRNI